MDKEKEIEELSEEESEKVVGGVVAVSVDLENYDPYLARIQGVDYNVS